MLYIGIDTGTNTGLAVWNTQERRFLEVKTLKIHEALDTVLRYFFIHNGLIKVRVEDARLRKWFGKADREKLQGVGSVKRDCKIWEDFLQSHKIDFKMVEPKNNKTKLSANYFKVLTKWQEQTSEHSRDAAMLVFNY